MLFERWKLQVALDSLSLGMLRMQADLRVKQMAGAFLAWVGVLMLADSAL